MRASTEKAKAGECDPAFRRGTGNVEKKNTIPSYPIEETRCEDPVYILLNPSEFPR